MNGLHRPKTGDPMERTLEMQRLHGSTWISRLLALLLTLTSQMIHHLLGPFPDRCPEVHRATCAVQGSRLEPICICWNQEILCEIATALVSPANAWGAKNCKLRKTPEDSTETKEKTIGERVTAPKRWKNGLSDLKFLRNSQSKTLEK